MSVYESIENSDRNELINKCRSLEERLASGLIQQKDEEVVASHISENPITLDRIDFLMQYVFHTFHHRGQIIALLREMDKDIPPTDYLHFFAEKK